MSDLTDPTDSGDWLEGRDVDAAFASIVGGFDQTIESVADNHDTGSMIFVNADGDIALSVPEQLRECVMISVLYLQSVLDNTDSVAYRRLFPAGYPDDDEAEQKFSLGRVGLIEARRQGIELVAATVTTDVLNRAEAEIWLDTLAAVRAAAYAESGADRNDETAAEFAQSDSPLALLANVAGHLGAELCDALDA